MTKQQIRSLPNTINSQKQVCANKSRIDKRINKDTGLEEIGEGQCNCLVDKTPEFTLEAYCEECRKPLEEKINRLIPPEGRNADLNKCVQVIQDYYQKIFLVNKRGLFLWGNPGVGKTWAQYAIIKRIVLSADRRKCCNDDIKIYSMSKIYDILREEQLNKDKEDGRFDKNYKDKICDVEILMIDDIGMEKMSDFRQEVLEYIFDTRCKNKKFTLITSNYSPGQLVGRIGGRINGQRVVSRITKMCEIIELKGKDRRANIK